eukprot:TRINITY_DN12527_c0_g1_i1.p1 TRINITY_DN12527_c0_g1~~TRINITY_DN12527_c0_g1_i1.p1  ORF type:complete len:250 (+),score=47.86 TRINITY_DN12527_c0_g1_i1:402-1151(+)
MMTGTFYAPYQSIGRTSQKEIERTRRKYQELLLKIDGVHGIGIGLDFETTQAPCDVLTLLVNDDSALYRVPNSIDGCPIQTIVTGPFIASGSFQKKLVSRDLPELFDLAQDSPEKYLKEGSHVLAVNQLRMEERRIGSLECILYDSSGNPYIVSTGHTSLFTENLSFPSTKEYKEDGPLWYGKSDTFDEQAAIAKVKYVQVGGLCDAALAVPTNMKYFDFPEREISLPYISNGSEVTVHFHQNQIRGRV